ncbi:prohead protease/major capsid protein fusion protein [Veillonella caviae]|uniref:prohead protease/major capsid protein fusion protein n=1 Tax=Veillonella caviae TaxID=248316 RepID=UPI0023F6BD2B|nr:prohead protease/major capsid protein fusion protein [Veillonella caviae]
MPKIGQTMQMMSRSLLINTKAINDDSRTLTLSFASEEPYERWFGPEVLQVDGQSLNMTRFENGLGCLLYNHNRDAVIGAIERVWIADNRAYADVRFDTDEESNKIYQKVKNGTLKGVSVGYRVNEYTEVKIDESLAGGRIKGPCYVATKWEAYEVSIVSVPADASVGVGRSLDDFNIVSLCKGDQTMENENNKPTQTENNAKGLSEQPTEGTLTIANQEKSVEPVVVPNVNDTAERAVQVERERVSQINQLCRHFNVDPEEYIRSGMDLGDVQTDVLKKAQSVNPPQANIRITQDESRKYRDAMSDALLLRSGVKLDKVADGAEQLRSMRLRSVVEDVLEREGVSNAHRMDENELLRAALTGTGALPGILSNVANKSMARGYQAAPTTFEAFTSVGSNVDFKEAKKYRLSEAGSLFEIKENGEFEHDEISESDASTRVLTYGRAFSFTRQMLVNDDLSALTRIPALYAAQAKRGINRLVYRTLADVAFSTKAGNLATTGEGLSLDAINKGRVAMRTQTNIRGDEMLNIQPKFLLVPTMHEFLARQLMTSTSDPNATHSGVTNPLLNSLQIISDAELDAIDTDAWFMLADPALMDTIEVTYLNGKQTPTIESQIAFDTLGIRYRIFMDYGVSVLDTKGLYKNAGK